MEKGRARDAPPVEWKEFHKAFVNQCIPKSVRNARAREFETLKQGSISVYEYDVMFVKLAEYALHIVLTEEDMIQRFVEGFCDSLFSHVGTQIKTYLSYSMAIDIA